MEQPPPYSSIITTVPIATGPPLGQMSAHITSSPSSNPNYVQQNLYPLYQPQPPYNNNANTNYGSIDESTSAAIPKEIIVISGCPVCRIGILDVEYTCLGLACAILLFPIGILCCLATKQRRCTSCDTVFQM